MIAIMNDSVEQLEVSTKNIIEGKVADSVMIVWHPTVCTL